MACQKCSQLDWNYDSEDEGDNSVHETVRIPHTKVNMGDLGTQSTRTSYLSAPASPAKKKTTSSNSNQHYHEGFLNHEDGNTDLMKTIHLIPPILMTVMMTLIQLTHTILQTWTLVGPKPNINPECIHFY